MPQSDIDPQSPTALIMEYLRKQGVGPTSDNVRSALEQQARDPGLIPGLRADYAPPDKDGSSVANRITGQGGSGKGTGRGLPTPPVPPPDPGLAKTEPGDAGQPGAPNTSAQPDGGGLDLSGLAQVILGGGAAGGLGALGARYLNRGPTLSVNPDAAGPAGRPGAEAGDRYNVLPDQSAESPMETAFRRATEPPRVPQLGSDVPDLSGVRGPPVQPGDVIGRPGLPPSVSEIDAINAGRGVQGVTGSSMPAPGEGNIPLRPRVSVQEVPVPTRPPMRNPYGRLLLR